MNNNKGKRRLRYFRSSFYFTTPHLYFGNSKHYQVAQDSACCTMSVSLKRLEAYSTVTFVMHRSSILQTPRKLFEGLQTSIACYFPLGCLEHNIMPCLYLSMKSMRKIDGLTKLCTGNSS